VVGEKEAETELTCLQIQIKADTTTKHRERVRQMKESVFLHK